ncbi:MAG: hypothetical protein ABSH51_21165 [Solirubrobacteraceae bacterium]|jgi:hypothetical protein
MPLQVPRNRHAIVSNPHAGSSHGRRRLLIGTTGDFDATLVDLPPEKAWQRRR